MDADTELEDDENDEEEDPAEETEETDGLTIGSTAKDTKNTRSARPCAPGRSGLLPPPASHAERTPIHPHTQRQYPTPRPGGG